MLIEINTGELVLQAERKYPNFDPLPDADNAAVGSHYTRIFYRRPPKDVSCFYFTTEEQGSLY